MCIATSQTLLTRMSLRLGLVIALMVGLQGTSSAQGIIIPRYRGPISPPETLSFPGMHYDPVDIPLLWTRTGEIVIAHRESYSNSGDVIGGTCDGSGIFILSLQHKTTRSLSVGKPVCQATLADYGLAIDSSVQWVIYTTHSLPSAWLVRINLRTGHSDSLSTGCSYVEYPALSRDNKWVAGTGWCFGRSNVQASLYIAHSDGSNPRRIAVADSVGIWAPSWSPDDKFIAFGLDTLSRTWINIWDVATGKTRIVTQGQQPSWSPDGRWIAFVASDTGKKHGSAIRIIHPDGTGERVVFRSHERGIYSRGRGPIQEGPPVGPIVWSPDSHAIVFARLFSRGTILWRLDIVTGVLMQVTEVDQR
jgi:hypothetical protein